MREASPAEVRGSGLISPTPEIGLAFWSNRNRGNGHPRATVKVAQIARSTNAGRYTQMRIVQGQEGWTLGFFIEDRGSNPAEGFPDSLDLKTRARFRWPMEQLRVRNAHAREPLVRTPGRRPVGVCGRREQDKHLPGHLLPLHRPAHRVPARVSEEETAQPGRELAMAGQRHGTFLAREGGRRGRP